MKEAAAGVLLVDKPVGPTCRALLDRLERRLGLGPLGHAGTLDPRASGLLVVLAGVARRLQDTFMRGRKVYAARVRLGRVSETLDSEGPVCDSGVPVPELPRPAVDELLSRFVGEIEQRPPGHSAVRLAGRRAHRLARAGRPVAPAPRRVRIDAVELLERAGDVWELRVTCGPGTYVRSLARDLGSAVGCGAYLEALRREASGSFRLEDARPPDVLTAADLKTLQEVLAAWPRIEVDGGAAARLCQGATVPGRVTEGPEPTFAWHGGRPVCRLRPVGRGLVRSDLRLAGVGSPDA